MKKLLLVVSILFQVAMCAIKMPNEKTCCVIFSTYLLNHSQSETEVLHRRQLISGMAKHFCSKTFAQDVLQEKIVDLLNQFNAAVASNELQGTVVHDVKCITLYLVEDFKNWPPGLNYKAEDTPLYEEDERPGSLEESLTLAVKRLTGRDDV